LAEEKNVVPKTATSINLNLPSALKEAYVGKLAQNEDSSRLLQQLDATKEKLKAVRNELQETQKGHQKDTVSLQEDLEDLQKRISEGEEEGKEAAKKTEEAQQRLSETITQAGCQRNEAQLQAVARVQKELGTHEREMALLRQEREALEGKLANAKAAVPTGNESPVVNRLKQKELELEEARQRLKHSEERYVLLVADAGGKQAVEDLGLRVKAVSVNLRPFTRPAESLRSNLLRSKSAVAFRTPTRESEDTKGPEVKGLEETGRDSETLRTPGGASVKKESKTAEGVNAPGSTRSSGAERLLVPSPCTSQPGPSISEVEVATDRESPTRVAESTPSPRTLDAPPKLLKANSEGSSQPASTPGEEALRSTEVVEAPSPKSGFELASPSQLPQTLAEARQREQRESEETHVSFADSAPAAVFMQPPSPVFLQPAEEPVPEQNEAETPLLRLEPAPCTQGSEVRTVAQSRNEDPAEVAGTPSNEAMELRETLPQAISSPPRRTPVPALAMSWAEMEVAALDPTPKCSEAVSPSYPASAVDGTVSPARDASCSPMDAPTRAEPRPVEANPPYEPVTMPLRQRSPSPVYCIRSPPMSPALHWAVPYQVPRPMMPIVVMPQMVQPVPLRRPPPPTVVQQAPAAPSPSPLPVAPPHPESQQSSTRSTPLPLYRLSCNPQANQAYSRSPSPKTYQAKAPMGMRWGIIGTEALSPRLREEASKAGQSQETEHVWVDDPVLSLRESSYMTGSPVSSESVRPSSPDLAQATTEPAPKPIKPFRRPQEALPKSATAVPKQRAVQQVQDVDWGSPDWATRALEGERLILPDPQLPPLEDLFAQNMLEQTNQRKLQKQQKRQEQMNQMDRAAAKPPPEPVSPVSPGFYKKVVNL